MRRVGGVAPRLGGSHESSANWAGYDATGGGFTSVTATWIQPAVPVDGSQDTDAAFWVGLDGDGTATVEQIGTEGYSESGVVGYDVWWEMYPGDSYAINMAISPGDSFTAGVTSNGGGSFTLKITNNTRGTSFTTTQHLANAQLYSAEVIAEAPSLGDSQIPLAPFGTVAFTGCAFNGQPISSFTWNQIDMILSGSTLATTSALAPGGTGFSVTSYPGSDTTPPVTTDNTDGLRHRSFVLKLTATDGGSGVAATQFRIDGGAWHSGTRYVLRIRRRHHPPGLANGTHTIQYFSTDGAGNVESVKTCHVILGS